MKSVLILGFFLISFVSTAQIIYKSKMDVLELKGGKKVCMSNTMVVWGIYGDSITFIWKMSEDVSATTKIKTYRELKTNEDWGRDGKLKRKIEDYIWREQYLDNKTRILPVEDIVTCDKFLIRFIIDKSGYIIFITALDKTPAYLFCFGLTCNLCGFHQL